jgi:hypothetical protein
MRELIVGVNGVHLHQREWLTDSRDEVEALLTWIPR